MECTFEGVAVGAATVQAPKDAKFYFLRATATNDVVIQFLNWKKGSALFQKFNLGTTVSRRSTPSAAAAATAPPADSSDRPYFCLSRANFDTFSRQSFATGIREGELAAGALILPIKMRPGVKGGAFDFSKDISIGTTAGWRVRTSDHRDTFVTMLGGVALSSASLTAENTGGAVTTTTDRAAVTWTTGAMVEIDRFQIGAFIGQDRISQPNQAQWVYQGKTWLAVGLGYSLFGASTPKPAAGQ